MKLVAQITDTYLHYEITGIRPEEKTDHRNNWGKYYKNLENKMGDIQIKITNSSDLEIAVTDLKESSISAFIDNCPLVSKVITRDVYTRICFESQKTAQQMQLVHFFSSGQKRAGPAAREIT